MSLPSDRLEIRHEPRQKDMGCMVFCRLVRLGF
jgi:hypothetical protein